MRAATVSVSLITLLALFAVGLAVLVEPAPPAGPPVAPATVRAETPVLPDDHLRIDDFEVRAVSLEAWHPMLLDGRTRADFLIAPAGATPTSQHHLAADLVRPAAPEPGDVAGVIARLAHGAGRDVSGFAGVELWMDATPGLYIVQLGSARVADHDHFNAYVEVTEPGWRHVRLPYESFRQEGYGRAVDWTGRDVVHLAVFGLNAGSSRLALDDVRFFER